MSKESKVKIHEGNALNKDFIAMTLPLLAVGMFFYGPRVLVLAALAVITARVADRLAAMLRQRTYDPTENSSTVMALLIVLMMPATVRFRVVVAAVLAAVWVGKEAFGGYNSYPFNPAAVGYCMAAISWPTEMFRYPEPQNWLRVSDWSVQNLWNVFRFQGANLVEGPSHVLRNGGLPATDTLNMLLGNYGGPIGTTCTVVILSCAIYLVAKKRMPLAAPVAFLLTVAAITFLFPRAPYDTWRVLPWYNLPQRLNSMKYELLSGSVIFAAVFLIDDPGTLPKNTNSRIIYGILLGLATVVFRYFGTYDLGICFAFLLVNAISGYFDRALVKAGRGGSRKAKRRKTAAAPKREVASQ